MTHQPLTETMDLWRNQLNSNRYSKQGQLREFFGLLDEAKDKGLIPAKEWRIYRSKWDKNPNDQNYLVTLFEKKLNTDYTS